MIQIKDKKDCCGCHACSNACPKQCITMQADNEGFLYPVVDKETCIDCGLCEKVCPVINQNEPHKPLHVYAAYNKDEEIRMQSSSGGIFTLLAEATINEGGVVFGAKFDKDWNVVHDYTETIDGIADFRGSKYVQSTIGSTYSQAKKFLQAGRKVLFSGTPCQIAGLKKYLRKEYDNLLTVDIICHGVPSPKVWNMYLEETYSKLLTTRTDGKNSVGSANGGTAKSCIQTIQFRSKISGWKKYSFLLKLNFPTCDGKNTGVFAETLDKNAFMRAFLSDTILRPSCYSCPAKQGKGYSDITIADFWGINHIDPSFDDDKGCGAIFLNTEKGANAYPLELTEYKEKTFDEVITYNSAYYQSSKPYPKREEFFKELDDHKELSRFIFKMHKQPISKRIKNRIKRYIKAILHRIKMIK